MAEPIQSGTLLVGEGVFMNGTINVPGVATIDGKIQGAITADTLYVTGNGAIAGKITANHIRVGGKLTDTTVANKTLVIESAGVVAGNITYADLEIKKGGSLQGSIVKVTDGRAVDFQSDFQVAKTSAVGSATPEEPII